MDVSPKDKFSRKGKLKRHSEITCSSTHREVCKTFLYPQHMIHSNIESKVKKKTDCLTLLNTDTTL